MIRSMTGFASTTKTVPLGKKSSDIVITIKAFNSRFFEANCKLSHSLSILEVDIIRLLKNSLSRGSIQCQIHVHSTDIGLDAHVSPAWQTLDGYVAAAESIADRYQIKNDLTVKSLLTLPHTFEVIERALSPDEHAAILSEINNAITILDEDRLREGSEIREDLHKLIDEIKELYASIPPRAEKILTLRKGELSAQLDKLLQNATQEVRDQQLVALDQQLNKLDIHEEIARFAAHIKQLTAILADTIIEKGKRLEFTLQELLREINTMAAKCPDNELTPAAIGIKVALEKLREQAQNIL